MTWDYGSNRGKMAYIVHEGMSNLVITQANVTTTGKAVCLQ